MLKVKINKVPSPKPVTSFPTIRMYHQDANEFYDRGSVGSLIVIFTSPEKGMAISGVPEHRLMKQENWSNCDDDSVWVRCTVELSSLEN